MVIGSALERVVKNFSDKLAVTDNYGKHFAQGKSLTYGELFDAVNCLANSFLDLGLKKGDRVAVQTGTGLGHFLTLLGLARVGMAIAPIDRTSVGDEIVYQLNDSGAKGFVVDGDIYEEKIAGIRHKLSSVEYFIGIGKEHGCEWDFDTLLQEGASDNPGIEVSEDDVATMIYTSGTTGRPKGAPLTHRNWLFSSYIWAAELRIHPYDRWLLVVPMHTSGGTGHCIHSFTRGCALYLTNPDAGKIIRTIQDEKITFTQFSPTLLAKVIRHPMAKDADFSSIERWFTSAATVSMELLKEGAELLGEKFNQVYGTTETALLATVLKPEEVSVKGPLARRMTSIGKACLGYETKVVDDEGKEVGPGGEGEIAVKGEAVVSGYWNRPDSNGFRDGWWYSGDIVRIDEDGFYYVIDRKKEMIVSGGLNVYPREVEDVISSFPGVNLVAVIGVPDEKWGEAVKAVIVLKDGHEAQKDELLDYCKQRMAPYKRPKSVDFISIDKMPMSGGGYKVLKRVLTDRYRQEYQKKKESDGWGAVY